MDKSLEILTEARRLLSINWIQGVSNIGNGYCMSGALCEAANQSYFHTQSLGKARSAIYDVIPNEMSIVGFNDTSGRTQQEVLDVMDKAINAQINKAA